VNGRPHTAQSLVGRSALRFIGMTTEAPVNVLARPPQTGKAGGNRQA
jgi:hypothetical protein